MDVLRKELEAFYESQRLEEEVLDEKVLEWERTNIRIATEVENDCRVITDAAADFCYIYGGKFSCLMGLNSEWPFSQQMDSSDEDVIYNRMHPEDLVDKRMLEYEFFKFVDKVEPCQKQDFKATCTIRLRDREEKYINVYNTTRVLHLSPNGKIWLILCTYDLAPDQESLPGIEPRILNSLTGEIIHPNLSERRSRILTQREKEILKLIREGKLSKQIADILGISQNTVNRHRQNILEKLSVGNSVEAVMAASAMKLL